MKKPKKPWSRSKSGICLCGRPAMKIRNGWCCDRCDRLEGQTGEHVNGTRLNADAKYATTYKVGFSGGLQ